jgi:hypothetical protein
MRTNLEQKNGVRLSVRLKCAMCTKIGRGVGGGLIFGVKWRRA